MKGIPIFKPGKHTAMNGASLEFSESDLQASIAAYDPAVHEAPLVVGHPKDNLPAYGWVKSLSFTEGVMHAEPSQVDAAFAELVNAGRFKKVSASFYTPDSPSNPKPGVYYLRHVGFLGAQPPAVKGLKSASFADAEEGVVEFSDWGHATAASLLRRLRDWFIDQFGQEKADQVLPDWEINSLRDAVTPPVAAVAASYSEPPSQTKEKPVGKTPDEIAAEKQAELDRREAEIKEREAKFAEAQKAQRSKEIVEFCDGLINDGRLAPVDKQRVVAFMEALGQADDQVIAFGEGDQKTEASPLKLFQDFMKSRPKLVEFGEVAPPSKTGNPEDLPNKEVAERARAYKAKREAAGQYMSYSEAVDAVHAGKDKE